MSERDPTGPNLQNLRALRPFITKAGQAMREGAIGGKGAPVIQSPLRPTRLCKICGDGFELKRITDDIELKHDLPCSKCDGLLKEGYSAFICDTRYCFGRHERLADMAGKIVQVEPHVMDTMQAKFDVQQRLKQPEDGKPEE